MTSDSCLFTIVSRNYLHFACTLMDSAAKHASWMDRVVCLCDSADGLDSSKFNFKLLTLRDLSIPDIDDFIFQYTILELNTALKPFVFEHIFNSKAYAQIYYFDPDIKLYSSLAGMCEILANSNILLTPHLTAWLEDGKHPGELAILQSGTYNLGFLGLRESPDARKLLTWWQSKMLRDCVVDIPRGLFVDQKWMDMVPGMYAGVHIERHPGWNTAYWNINHREVIHDDQSYTVNGAPLVFFHFSGIGLDGKIFSKHQDRYTLQNLAPSVCQLMQDYVNSLRLNHAEQYRSIAYAFGSFSDGTPVPDLARLIFREQRDQLKLNLSTTDGERALIAYVNGTADDIGRSHPLITRMAYKLYQISSDLRLAFPDVFGADANRYADWFVQNASEQAKLPEIFIAPVRDALHRKVRPGGLSARFKAMVWRGLYGPIWRSRKLLRRFVSYELRHKLHAWLLRSAFESHPAPSASVGTRRALSEVQPGGLNVLGYLFAESGVGQAARSSLQALKVANLGVCALDFRLGNVSRMHAEIDTPLATSPRFAINLLHINADQTGLAHQQMGEGFFRGRYNIASWAWELPEFPDQWRAATSFLDEIWVPSFFCQEAVSAKIELPVIRMPYCITPHVSGGLTRQELSLPEDSFLFGFIFDVLSVVERKNPFAVLDAFRLAFGHSPKQARLVLKLMNTQNNPEFMRSLAQKIQGDPAIVVLGDYLSRQQLNGLLENLDCYVSLHRSEGFGLTLAESMSMGKPVIATAWSGNMDFMNAWNSFPVRYDIVELRQDHGPYKKGCHWANPSVEHAAECMQIVFNDADLRARISAQARNTIAQDFSPATLGKKLFSRIETLNRNR